MTTPEPPGEPTPPSFDKAGATGGGSPYGESPYGQQPPAGGDNPYGGSPYGSGQPSYTPPAPGAEQAQMPPLAPLGTRLLARTLDIVLVAVISVPISLIAWAADRHDSRMVSLTASLALLLVSFIYEGLMLTRSNGQTVGKKLMKLRVAVLADGRVPEGAPGWTRAAVWALPGALLCGCAWWIVDGAWVTWDQPYRQALHDKAAKTVVVTAV